MKQLKEIKKNKLVAAIILALVVIAGIIIICTIGFNVEMQTKEHKQIQFYLQKEFNISDIREITNEVFPAQEVIIQKVEAFEDSVQISALEITEEQENNLVTKLNEKYELNLTAEDQEIVTVPKTRISDILRPNIMPFVIATIIILLYFAIKYRKLRILKVILKTIITLAISEALLLSVIAITRIPVGKYTVSMIFAVYVLALGILTSKLENKLQKTKLEEQNKK